MGEHLVEGHYVDSRPQFAQLFGSIVKEVEDSEDDGSEEEQEQGNSSGDGKHSRGQSGELGQGEGGGGAGWQVQVVQVQEGQEPAWTLTLVATPAPLSGSQASVGTRGSCEPPPCFSQRHQT